MNNIHTCHMEIVQVQNFQKGRCVLYYDEKSNWWWDDDYCFIRGGTGLIPLCSKAILDVDYNESF